MRRRRARRGGRLKVKTYVIGRNYYCYRISLVSSVYVGFTSRPPQIRLEEHRDNSFDGKSKFYRALKNNEITSFTYKEYPTELEALLAEIHGIASLSETDRLNTTKGGEGNSIRVSILKDGTVRVKEISDKAKKARAKWIKARRAT